MNFLDFYASGDYARSLEDNNGKKLVMDKTVSVSTDESEEKVKVDHLDSDNSLEKDVLAARQAERDVRGTVPLPLFRFVEKQLPEIKELITTIVDYARTLILDKGEKTDSLKPLFGFITINRPVDIEHFIELTILRNKETFNTSDKGFNIELISCYCDKKIRTKFQIEEDKIIDEKNDVEYVTERDKIKTALNQLLQYIIEHMNLKETGTQKDIELVLDDSSGGDSLGIGFSIFLKYTKNIDYMNARRGRESYGSLLSVLDEDFVKKLDNEEKGDLKEEQNNINPTRSAEAIADGMSDDESDESEGDDGGGDDENVGDDESADDEGDGGDDFGDDESFGDDEGDEDDSGFDTGGDDDDDGSDSSSSSGDTQKISGQNPFADINSKEKISIELNELKEQIDKVLLKLSKFKSNVVVRKLIELRSFVEDALKNAYIVTLQASLIRYSMYVTQFEDLISALEQYIKKQN
ncbi:MAG: hypothetical protein ACRC5M_04735 [Anaeroplasmataceae bacterium]